MKYFNIVCLVLISFQTTIFAQEKYVLSKETVESKSPELIKLQQGRAHYPAGRNKNLLVYQMNKKRTQEKINSNEASLRVYYDEASRRVVDSTFLPGKIRKVHKFKQLDDVVLLHGFFDVPQQDKDKEIEEFGRGSHRLEYQDIWVVNGDTGYLGCKR
jgi:hypothetical protein